jgi:methyltransferase NSUN6
MANNNNLPVVNFDEAIEKIASVGFESEEWNQVLQSLSLPPITTFIRVDLTKWTIEEAKLFLEKAIDDQCCDKGWHKFDICILDSLPDVLYLNARGPNKVAPTGPEVVIDISCGNAVLRGADVFVVGILAAQTMQAGELVSVYVDIDGKCLRGQSAKYTGKKVFLGNGTRSLTKDSPSKQEVTSTAIPQSSFLGRGLALK